MLWKLTMLWFLKHIRNGLQSDAKDYKLKFSAPLKLSINFKSLFDFQEEKTLKHQHVSLDSFQESLFQQMLSKKAQGNRVI